MNTGNSSTARQRLLRFGPGTILAGLITIITLAANAFQRTGSDSRLDKGSITWQVNARGQMERTGSSNVGMVPNPIRPLWKPEVDLLLNHAADLKLTVQQAGALQTVQISSIQLRITTQQYLTSKRY